MEVKQIYELVNTITKEITGQEVLVAEDLSNIVDVGTEIFNASSVDNYVRSLVNHIGRVVFVNRPYTGGAPSVLMDGWEYGSVMEKITAEMPEAEENESWELQDGESYDQNIFYKPEVSAKFFNKRVTFEVPMSFTEMQVKESFSDAAQLNGFISMLYNAIDKSMTVKMDSLIMRTINNMIGETIYTEYGSAGLETKSTIKAVNLLFTYNQQFGKTLSPVEAMTEPEFIRYASYIIGLYISRMSKISTLFNIGGKDRFTPRNLMHIILLSDFMQAANVYLQSGVFHDNLTALPLAEEVPYWQGSGTGYDFNSITGLNLTTASGNVVNATGILGVIFDRDALGVTNLDRRVTTHYNAKAEFYNNWFKFDAGYFNDMNENFVVFFVA